VHGRVTRCPYQKLVRRVILEPWSALRSRPRARLNLLRSLFGAALLRLKTRGDLALEKLALRHRIGVLKRSVGKRRLRLGAADRGL
jgi:hypothetical protein